MNNNIKLTLKALVELGFNLTTGTSGKIFIKNIQEHSGVIQNGNGSRIIRRDSKVFGLYNIKWYYSEEHGNLEAIKFLGYKTSSDVVSSIEQEILKWESKIVALKSCIEDNYKALEWVGNNDIEDLTIHDLCSNLLK